MWDLLLRMVTNAELRHPSCLPYLESKSCTNIWVLLITCFSLIFSLYIQPSLFLLRSVISPTADQVRTVLFVCLSPSLSLPEKAFLGRSSQRASKEKHCFQGLATLSYLCRQPATNPSDGKYLGFDNSQYHIVWDFGNYILKNTKCFPSLENTGTIFCLIDWSPILYISYLPPTHSPPTPPSMHYSSPAKGLNVPCVPSYSPAFV